MVELVKAERTDRETPWETKVFQALGESCQNCGSVDRVRPVLVVPEEAGGKKILSNSTVLCRVCILARDIDARKESEASGENTRPMNFWMSRGLHERLKDEEGLAKTHGFRSVSALVRFLMERYVQDPDRFDDVSMYQDPGTDVKQNVWVSRDLFAAFRDMAVSHGLTVTDAIKGLLRLFEAEVQKAIGGTRR
jgi:hypothetical protein